MRYLVTFVLLLSGFFLVSCGTTIPQIDPYKLESQQGNVVTSKMLLKLRAGMTKSQVRFVMGTPLMQDSFHENRWNYIYQMREAGKLKESRRVVLEFDNADLLKSVRSDLLVAKDSQAKMAANTDVKPDAATSSSFWSKLKFWDKKDTANKQEVQTQVITSNQIEVEPSPPNATANKHTEADSSSFWDKLKFWKSSRTTSATNTALETPSVSTPENTKSFWSKLKFWGAAKGSSADADKVATPMPEPDKSTTHAMPLHVPASPQGDVVVWQGETSAPPPATSSSAVAMTATTVPNQPTIWRDASYLATPTLKFETKLNLAMADVDTSPPLSEPSAKSTGFLSRMLEKIGF